VRAIRLVIAGTGTGVGKTHVGCSLLACWGERGVDAIGCKPVETGVSEEPDANSDHGRLSAAVGMFHVKRGGAGGRAEAAVHAMFHVKRPLYAFADGVSPHLAARSAGARIDLASIRRWVSDQVARVVVVETAGGLFTPLADGVTNFDLVGALGATAVLIVAPDRLGVLHDLTAALGLATARGLQGARVVLSEPEIADASTGRNATELTHLGIADPIAVFPRAPPFNPASRAAAELVVRWAEGPGQVTSR
jgi:dethiobiotin synthetase